MEFILEWTKTTYWKDIVTTKTTVTDGRPLGTTNTVKGRLASFVHAVRQGATGNWKSGWIESDEAVTKYNEETFNESQEASFHQVLMRERILEDINAALIDEGKVSDVYLLEPRIVELIKDEEKRKQGK